MRLIAGSGSNIGHRRQSNQDLVWVQQDSNLFLICDGLGGQDAGDLAARLSVETLVRELAQARILGRPAASPERASAALRTAIAAAHQRVSAEATRLRQERPMGSTLVAALALDRVLVLGSVGDSRAYLAGPKGLRRLTEDHTLGQQYAELGLIRKDEAKTHALRNVLTRSIGSPHGAEPDIQQIELRPGERLILCSDGLTDMLGDAELARLGRDAGSAQECTDRLIQAALQAGGRDNVSVVVLERLAETDQARSEHVTPCSVGA